MNVTQISPDWQTLQGTTLDGGYELKDILEATEDRAVLRVRVLGDYTLKASATFYALDDVRAEEQIGIWQSIRYFESKAAVSTPLGSGKLKLNSTTVAYVVYQTADETLADALAAQSLSPEQAVDATRSIARGLSELHANGYVHGNLAPEEVRAVGDRVEISTETIRRANTGPIVEQIAAKYRAPETDVQNITIAADIWCLGATLFEALTQTAYEPVLREKAAALQHPFGTLLDGCLDPDPDRRLKLIDFEPILRSKAPPPRPKPVEPVSVETPKTAAAAANNGPVNIVPAAEPVSAIQVPQLQKPDLESRMGPAKPVRSDEPAKIEPRTSREVPIETPPLFRPNIRQRVPDESRMDDSATGFSARRGWLYAGAAFVAIFAILWFVHARNGQNTGPVPSSANTTTAKKPGAAWPTTTLTPDAKTTATPSPTVPAVPKASRTAAPQSGPRSIWRVVLYTYMREPDAQKRASEIAAKRPDLHAEVFAPDAGGPYLVVAGEGTTRDDAARTRLRAIREGMPRDSYIQNYSH